MTSTPDHDHADHTQPQPSSPDLGAPAPEGSPDAPKRRRRRRGGRGRARAGAPGDTTTGLDTGATETDTDTADAGLDPGVDSDPEARADNDEAPRAPGAEAQGTDGTGRRRRRRRRGRGGSGATAGEGAPGEGAPGAPTRTAPSAPARAHDDTEDDDDQAPPPARPRSAPKPVDPAQWEEIFGGQTFADLGLRNSVLKGVDAAGFKNPTKIQAEMIPLVLAGRDVLGQSRTGTGKTAAFGLPLYHLAMREMPFQSLILAPTRELAIQIAAELAELGKFTPVRVSAVYGGQNVGAQARQLDKGPEIIVATPGRLMDMVERGHVHLRNVRFAILDEVDRMLDIGFREDIKKILSSIKQAHQTVFVSATISEEIERLARSYMKDPAKLVTTGGSLTVSLVEQHYLNVEPWDKRRLLLHLLTHEEPDLTVVFCRTKRTVDELARYLHDKGVDAHPMHGDMYQGKRNSVMKRLREGELGVLVASDLAARGLDVDGISHVVNYDLPEDPEVYIHRIGRTARAGRGGVAWSLVTPEQGPLLTQIEKLANTHVPKLEYPDFKPGPVPSDIAARRSRDSAWKEAKPQGLARNARPQLPFGGAAPAASSAPVAPTGSAPVAVAAVAPAPDPSKFPGGLVPTKLPPKMLGGRVRSMRSGAKAPAPAPAPGTPPAGTDGAA